MVFNMMDNCGVSIHGAGKSIYAESGRLLFRRNAKANGTHLASVVKILPHDTRENMSDGQIGRKKPEMYAGIIAPPRRDYDYSSLHAVTGNTPI